MRCLRSGSDPEVTRFFSWGPYTSIEEPAVYIAGLAGERERGERLDFVIVDHTDRVLGVTGLSELSPRDRRAVVGTWLGRAYWGTGVNRAAKAMIARLAFRALGLERLGAYADLENPRSQAALTRLGFQREGVLRHWHRHGDTVHDVITYSWLKEEWERSDPARDVVAIVGSGTGGVPVRQLRRCSQLKPRTASAIPSDRPGGDHAERADVRAQARALDHRAREAVDQMVERQRLGDALERTPAPWRRRRTRRRRRSPAGTPR